MSTSDRHRLNVAVAGLASAALVAGMAVASSAAPAPDDSAEVEGQLRDALADGSATEFWVYLRESADLSRAASTRSRAEQGELVYEELTSTAEDSQSGLVELLDSEGADYEQYWIANAVLVTGDEVLVERIADLPEVERIAADRTYELPEPIPAEEQAQLDGVEWGIEAINAPQVWDEFDTTGEGIVVGVIDGGARYQHEALVNQYRGNLGGGGFDHNHNWHDPSNVCGNPSLEPCDNTGHGTHVTGTIVGDDGGDNKIGVAPGATWIAAKGCESRTCSQGALLSSGQFMLAPTDLNGRNPRPDLRPHVVNNSWGGGATTDPWYQAVVEAWVAAGIFPQFAGGNWTSSATSPCGTASNPANLPASYAAGAFDADGNIAGFSRRGPSAWGDGDLVKPNLAAPGVAVRSAWHTGGYNSISGTSMASPHVAGTVALMWSAAIALERDVAATRDLLDQTAVDVEDLVCGGTAGNNNVWGQGKLDAHAAVAASPRGPVGTLRGTVTDAETGDPIRGAALVIDGETSREDFTGPDGGYAARLLAGEYTVTVSAFGYETGTVDVTVVADEATTQDVALHPVDSVTLSGQVTDGSDHGWPLYAEVTVEGTPVSTFTDPLTGAYTMSVPAGGTYTLVVESMYPGYAAGTATVEADAPDLTHDIALPVERCHAAPGYEYGADIGVLESVSGDLIEHLDARGIPATQLGWEDDPSPYDVVIANIATGPATTQPYLDFLDAADDAGVGMLFLDSFVTQTGIWQLRQRIGNPSQRTNGFGFTIPHLYYLPVAEHPVLDGFEPGQEIVFDETSQRKEHAWFDGYVGDGRQVIGLAGRGDSGPMGPGIGVQQRENNRHVLLSMHASRPGNGMERWTDDGEQIFFNALSWLAPDATFECLQVEGGLAVGHVTDLNTDAGVNGAAVAAEGEPATSAFAPGLGDGFYWLFAGSGSRQITASAQRYVEVTETVQVGASTVHEANFELPAGRISLDTHEVEADVAIGRSAEREITFTNTGTGPVAVALTELEESFDILASSFRAADGDVQFVAGQFTTGVGPDRSAPALADEETAVEPAADDWPAAAPWTDLPNYPMTIMDNAAAVADGKLYSFGGYTGVVGVADSFVFNPASNQWSRIASLPDTRQQAIAVEIGGLIYVVGGWDRDFEVTSTTFIYDPASNSWTRGADLPAGRAAAGATVLDGRLYLVGGCTSSGCAPMANSVWRFDPAADEWEELADYPRVAAYPACAGLGGQVICAGGVDPQAPTAATFAYDPAADAWEPRASLPYTNWGMAYAAAGGQLVVSGGITGSSVTNRSAAYVPEIDLWTDIEPANVPVYRGASACGFYRVGGSLTGFTPVAHGEQHPDFDDCVLDVEVPWLTAEPAEITLEPGDAVVVTVTLDSGEVDQPGTYTAGLGVLHDTPYPVEPVDITMVVVSAGNSGKITGTVTALTCPGEEAPLAGAIVQLNGKAGQHTLRTDPDGRYELWLGSGENPLEVIVATGSHVPQVHTVSIRPQREVVVDVVLAEIC